VLLQQIDRLRADALAHADAALDSTQVVIKALDQTLFADLALDGKLSLAPLSC
jgi:hypothetical protein